MQAALRRSETDEVGSGALSWCGEPFVPLCASTMRTSPRGGDDLGAQCLPLASPCGGDACLKSSNLRVASDDFILYKMP
jgi:hypothetical protein